MAALLHGRRSESGETDHVAGCIDVRDRRLEVIIDRQAATRIRLETDRFKIEVLRRAFASNRIDQGGCLDSFGMLQVYINAVVFLIDREDLFLMIQRDADVLHLLLENFDNFRIDELQQARTFVDERDGDAQRGHDRGVLRADDTAADYDDRIRNVFEGEKTVRVDDRFIVEGNVGRSGWLRTDGDHDEVCRVFDGPAGLLNAQSVRIFEAGSSVDHIDPVASHLIFDDGNLVRDDVIGAEG